MKEEGECFYSPERWEVIWASAVVTEIEIVKVYLDVAFRIC